MKFQRHLLSKRRYPTGYFAPASSVENYDMPLFELGGGPTEFCVDQPDFPDTFSVQARLEPILYENHESFFVSLKAQGQALTPYKLYQPEKLMERYGCLQAFEIHFENFLSKKIDELVLTEQKTLLYRKDFFTQRNSLEMKYEIQEGKWVMVPFGVPGKQVLWSYGGFYQPGCHLYEIEQLLFTPGREPTKTVLHLSRISNWHLKEHEAVFVDSFNRSQKLSLLGEIEEGAAKFEVLKGIDENGDKHFVVYQSFAVHQRDRLSDLITIDFRKEK